MGNYTSKTKHVEVSPSSSSSSSSSHGHVRRSSKRDDAHLRKLIRETLLEFQVTPPFAVTAGVAVCTSSSSELEGPSQEEQKGKYISKELLPPLVKHVRMNMDFPDVEVPGTSSGSLLCQFQSSAPVDVPIHPCIQEVIKREWKDPEKIILPRFMAKLYPLQDMAQVLPDSVPIDSFVSSLFGRTSLPEDAVIQDSVDKKVDVSLKKSYAGTHLALGAGIYGAYVAQSLLSDLKALNSALDGSSDSYRLMSLIERQVEFLSDISFDVVWASALAEGSCVSARRNLVLRDWRTDAAQLASALRFLSKAMCCSGQSWRRNCISVLRRTSIVLLSGPP
ncbi:hypothetical protein NDU88_002612 [Pleurodeles waltl]|uniref:Lamina-associated polypeptide 2 alpha C-terminal domain-containing protein n=1 Tax=Pleurodeles waltl TaxID=8319 RepID=A0AAV7UA99_PLEWA|nr:hypothetical protein NDU88_002612 [Pleurodeles waltl]